MVLDKGVLGEVLVKRINFGLFQINSVTEGQECVSSPAATCIETTSTTPSLTRFRSPLLDTGVPLAWPLA